MHFSLNLLITVLCLCWTSIESIGQVRLIIDAVDESAGNVPCFKIETPSAIYFLEKEGMGLSSMIDKDGNDWISFHKEPGSGAAGEYRGFPNAVHQQDGSFFHPKNTGTEKSMATVDHVGRNHVSIIGISGNNNWECRWDFYATHCTFTMIRMPAGYKYWVLYEGTPGGQYDDTDWWMTSANAGKTPLTISHEGDLPSPEWIAFGDKSLMKRSIFLLHHQDDDHPDRFYQMRNQMTVFGFGRQGIEKFIDRVPQSFSIGFIESINHQRIKKTIDKIFKRNLLN